jgi:NAD(P)-dependent dehydrogenase (short-subunit alcohol dehydrogenase family)
MARGTSRLDGHVAVVTGGSRGIGRAIAEGFGRAGARVVIASSQRAVMEQSARELSGQGFDCLGLVCDVAERGQVERLRDEALNAFGKIDIWVNNAGISGPFGYTLDVPPAEWEQVIRVNLLGTYHGCTVVLPHMIERRYGRIINLSGGGATRPQRFLTAYSASKAAIVNFSKGLARDYKDQPGLAINVLTPGIVPTDMTDFRGTRVVGPAADALKAFPRVMKMFGTTLEECAELALKLASPDLKRTNGKVFTLMPRQRAIWRIARAVLGGAKS